MSSAAGQTRFVVLIHDGIDSPHLDLMFETSPESLLSTWRSERWPIDRPTVLRRIDDHRRAYLEFEGELSNDRGRVQRVAAGLCKIDRHDGDTFWSIHFDDGVLLNLRQADGGSWLAVPSCGG